jgi:choline dehydrogenase-like flavoprotein
LNKFSLNVSRLADNNGNRVYQLEAGGSVTTITAPATEAERQLLLHMMGRAVEFGLAATEPQAP